MSGPTSSRTTTHKAEGLRSVLGTDCQVELAGYRSFSHVEWQFYGGLCLTDERLDLHASGTHGYCP